MTLLDNNFPSILYPSLSPLFCHSDSLGRSFNLPYCTICIIFHLPSPYQQHTKEGTHRHTGSEQRKLSLLDLNLINLPPNTLWIRPQTSLTHPIDTHFLTHLTGLFRGRKTRETKTNQRFLFQVLHLKSFTTQLNKNHNHNISLLGLMMLHNRDRSHGFVASAESAILIQMYYILSPTISLRNCDPRCTIKLRQLIAQQYIQNPLQWFRHSPVLTTNNECPNDWQTTSSGNSMTE